MVNFDKMTSVELICLHLRCTPRALQDFVSSAGGDFYQEIHVRRRRTSAKPRIVYEVRRPLRRVHKLIADGLKPHVEALPTAVQAYRKGASILKNATEHVGKPWVTTADIRDFYGHITLPSVVRVFEIIGASRLAAVILGRICTFGGILPQGGRASPAIANLAVQEMDRQFGEVGSAELVYTRYVDDLAFSGTRVPERSNVEDIASRFGFTLSSFRAMKFGTGQIVTGLSVDNPEGRPRMTRWKRREIERVLHYAETVGFASHLARTGTRQKFLPKDPALAKLRLIGLIDAYAPIEPALAAEWRLRLRKITEKSTDVS